MRAILAAVVLLVACDGESARMGDYVVEYAEARADRGVACGHTGNREKVVDTLIGDLCGIVDCDAPARGDLDACLDAIAEAACDDPLTPAECVTLWYE